MANLTISVNDEVLKRARIRALEENSSVNTVLGQYLEVSWFSVNRSFPVHR